MNQVQKNAKDINSRLMLLERTVLFKRYHSKLGSGLPDSKVRRSDKRLSGERNEKEACWKCWEKRMLKSMEGRHMYQNLGSTITRLPANDLSQLKVLSALAY